MMKGGRIINGTKEKKEERKEGFSPIIFWL